MSNTFSLDGKEYAYEMLSPAARGIVDAIQETNQRIGPLQRDIFIYNMAVDRMLGMLRVMLETEGEATEAEAN